MGFAEVLTLILVVLKLLGVISIGWLLVFTPLLVVYGLMGLAFVAIAALAVVAGGKK